MLLHSLLFLFFIAVASVCGADTGALNISSSIVAIRHQTIPAVVQPIQHAVQCPSCFDYTVASAPSHFKTQSVGAHGHDSGYTFDELTIPWQQCVHGVCQNITIAVAQRTPKPIAMRYISLDEHQKAHLLNHQRRPLFFLGAAALGVAVTALTEVRALKSAFYAFQEKILANLTQIQAQLNILAENVYEIKDGLKRLSANSIISVANAQILAMRANSRLSAAMLRMTHIPAYLAAATLSAARVMNLRVPVHFGGELEAFVRDGSNQVVLKKSLENSFYHYLGLILPTQRVTDMLTTLGYLYNPCGHDPFLISDIQEALMPWGSVAYSAIVYAVFPKVDFNPSILLRTCSSIFGQNLNTPNTGCFDTPTSAQSERIRKTTLYQSGSAYAVVVPVDAHDSRDSLTSAYSITDYINVKGESAYENECSSSRFPSAGVASLVYLPLPTRVAVSQSGRQSELGVQCFDPDSFNAQFQGDTLCAPNFIAFPAGVRMDGPPTIGTIPFPEYHGEVDYLSGGTINFKTLAISEATVDVMLLRANVTYFYQTSIGFARTPDFYDEWVTEDGRSVPEELINQYTSWGIATGYTNGSTLQGLVSIPASVYTLPPVGDARCYSEACARNRLNYEWNGRSYGKALYPIVIADATEPIPCSATFDCSTVGPKARPGSTPTPCGDSQAVCCNAQGYVCFVKFSGTDSLGNMITVGPDGATGFNIKDYLNRTLPGVLPIWDFQERLENATKKLREEMNKTFPVTWTSAESDMGDFFDVVTDGLKAAAEAPLKVANEALDLVKKLNPLGFASDLFGWLLNLLVMLLFAAIAIGVCVCCFKVALDCGGSGRGGITRYFPVGNSDSSASSSLN